MTITDALGVVGCLGIFWGYVAWEWRRSAVQLGLAVALVVVCLLVLAGMRFS